MISVQNTEVKGFHSSAKMYHIRVGLQQLRSREFSTFAEYLSETDGYEFLELQIASK